ncbi:MAG: phytoene desaturase [Ilumatobacter sp.]|jgi:phytoene desaturase
MKHVVIVGGGVGGLAAAIRLRAIGHTVTIFERNDVAGGKLATFERDGFTFDIGPSLLTLPHVFDEVLALAGTNLEAELDLVRLDPQFRYHWRNGGQLRVHDDADATAAAFDTFSPGSGDAWRGFNEHGRKIWEVSERTFFAGPMDNPIALLKRMRSPKDLATIDALRTLNDASRATFDSPELQQWANRYATYSGSSPRQAPATLACIPHIEAEYGCWYPMGGLGALRDALVRAAIDQGVTIETGSDVAQITTQDQAVTGVKLIDGSTTAADIVIANVDAEHLYGDLIDDEQALKQVRKAGRSTSGFALCIGASGTTENLGHHNVWFSDDYAQEFRELDAGQLANDPTIYGCVSSVTDPSQAPAGSENWFLLVNTPPGADIDAPAYRDLVLERLAAHGVDLRDRMQFCARLTPADIEAFYRSPGGAIYGTASNGKQAAFARPANRGTKDGLYLVGGSSHPGGGLPLVATSAKIVCEMIAQDNE